MMISKKDKNMLVGRAVKNRKTRVDAVKRFEIQYLLDNKALSEKDHNLHLCEWRKGGKATGLICFQIGYDEAGEPKSIRFSYSIMNQNTGDKKDYDYSVKLVATACNFGGKRWWFICPFAKNGVACGRRCSILYLPGNYRYLGCRICYELTYESRQRHRDGFYENYEKPVKRMEQAYGEFRSANTLNEKLAILKTIKGQGQIIMDDAIKFWHRILKD